MTGDTAPTIAETISAIQASLRDYIEATYHVGHAAVVEQRRHLLEQEGVLYRAPFIESTPRYTSDRRFGDLQLDGAVQELFAMLTQSDGDLAPMLYDPPYSHQAKALEWASRDRRSLVVTTGTGSGKTETFLLPMLAKLATEAAHRPQSFERPAIRALVLYPMNALVNDQLGRMRLLLADPRVTTQFMSWAGRPARFARYTSRTLYPGVRTVEKDKTRLRPIERFYIRLLQQAEDANSPRQVQAVRLIESLQSRGKWPAKPDLKVWYGSGRWQNRQDEFIRAVMQPEDAELFTRAEVLKAPPDVLITNYSMLEYMMMRPLERPVFDRTREWLASNPDERFLLIIDEAHLYRGAAGAEVALLLRRLRSRLDVPSERLQVICTSASFDDPEYARQFAAQLSGKSAGDFTSVTGTLALREQVSVGTAADAERLNSIPLRAFYDAHSNDERVEAIRPLLDYRETQISPHSAVGALLQDALKFYGPMSLLINETMRQARPVAELGSILFPGVDQEVANRAASTLVALGSAARRTTDDAGLLPCRVHAFFRGLPGLWACLDPLCSEVDRSTHSTGPIGKLYAQPRAICECGARVFEFFTCRDCGTSYARAYTNDILAPKFLWQEPGGSFLASSGTIPELWPIDLLLEEPDATVEPAQLDLVTGRLNPHEPGDRVRPVFLPAKRAGETVSDDDDDEVEVHGEFIPCGVCQSSPRYGRSTVQDHQTKGDQPFLALVTRQLEVQPPGQQPATTFAPLRGRKVLAFSDSRQVAARLAPNLQTYSMRDAMRPVVLRGWHELLNQPLVVNSLSLEHLYLSSMIGATLLGVRLRPELGTAETLAVSEVKASLERGALRKPEELIQLLTIQAPPPQSLLHAIYATVTDRYYGLASLGLASLRERANLTDQIIGLLPDLPGLATTPEAKLAMVRLWLAQWASPRAGIRFNAMTSDWIGTRGGIKTHTGNFKAIIRWLEPKPLQQVFRNEWLPSLRDTFCESVTPNYRLLASTLALDVTGTWGYCERCRFTQRPFPGQTRCVACRTDRVRVLDPDTDAVFSARKGYYRASAVRALIEGADPPVSLIAAEHTAQLNSSQSEAVFSKAEEHELLFQDVNIEAPGGQGLPPAAIDVLSCTTTMEVGIDIGSLSGVALRNMPPSRANYQQRAGRAGRRGNAVATVVAFGSSDTHDDHYFREPAAMISGRVDDPVLTMDNHEIARRHLTAYLLQRYHQDRLPKIAPDQQPQLFEVLGTVQGFVSDDAVLSRSDFELWLEDNAATLRGDADAWLPSELRAEDRGRLLDGIVTTTLRAIDKALDLDDEGQLPNHEEGDAAAGNSEVQDNDPAEDGAEPSVSRGTTNLLDRLLYKGVLPRYAFPTDVVAFHVFDQNNSTRFRAQFLYEPSQGLPVALSQYAPGKVVWVDNKEWRSGAIYSPVQQERFRAYQTRKLYLECQVCHFATHVAYDQAERGRRRDCPACGATDRFGAAMSWMRPPGFAHRVDVEPGTSPDDAPARSYATRAKLVAEGPADDDKWEVITDRLIQNYGRKQLIVTNTGPRGEGYIYCTQCGLIEPVAQASGIVNGTHRKPFPDPQVPNCPGTFATRGLVLGTDFISDVLLIRLNVTQPVTLQPAFLSTHVALRTIAEGLTIAATRRLDIEATELQAEYRPALTPLGHQGLASEIYLYDTLAGGAGFARRVTDFGLDIFRDTLALLDDCPGDCDESCYRCLRSFRNRFEHGSLDRRIGASLLRYLLDGTSPDLDPNRLDQAAQRLYVDVMSHGIEHVKFRRNVEIDLTGIGAVTAPILAQRGDRQWIFGVHSPMTPDVAPNELLRLASEFGSSIEVKLIDAMVISRNLPFATQLVRNALQ